MDEIVAFMQKYRALVFTPEELHGVDPELLEAAMIAEGNDVVDYNADDTVEIGDYLG